MIAYDRFLYGKGIMQCTTFRKLQKHLNTSCHFNAERGISTCYIMNVKNNLVSF